MKLWREWGFNIVRLGTMWPGFEPEEGQYNQTYLETLEQIVNNGAKYGIFTLLDFHQDCLSPKLCGEGLPDWATDVLTGFFGSPFPFHWSYGLAENEIPTQTQCKEVFWNVYQGSLSGSSAYQALYDNTNGIWVNFANFWKSVAKLFSKNDFVVGYELINEPWIGNFYYNPLRLLSGYVDKNDLQPLYDYLNNEIRTIDPNHLIFFEPAAIDSSTADTGFTHPPGGDEYADRSVLSFHYYQPPNGDRDDHFRTRRINTVDLKIGGMLTEFSVMHDNYIIFGGIDEGLVPTQQELDDQKNENPLFFNLTDQHLNLDVADKYLFSWIGWEYKLFTPITGAGPSVFNFDGSKNETVIATLSRTYAQAVAGQTEAFYFNNSTAEFRLDFQSNAVTNDYNTEIYLNEAIHYPNGFNLDFETPHASYFTYSQVEPNYLSISTLNDIPISSNVTIKITRK